MARLLQRVSAAWRDYLHKVSAGVAKNHGTVVLEALDVRTMARSASRTMEKPGRNVRQKAGLNRSIFDQGWGAFRVMPGYKLAERGGRLLEVSASYTSQTCAACGVVGAASRVSQARFVCTACGHTANADTNAAVNILCRAGSSVLPVEASQERASEAGTIPMVA